jgi:hypothetical protein
VWTEARCSRAPRRTGSGSVWTTRWSSVRGCPFPVGPVRALDALHLATALAARAAAPDVRVLSPDQRVRENAARFGFAVVP